MNVLHADLPAGELHHRDEQHVNGLKLTDPFLDGGHLKRVIYSHKIMLESIFAFLYFLKSGLYTDATHTGYITNKPIMFMHFGNWQTLDGGDL